MVRLNNTIDNNDPLILYNGDWREGSSADPLAGLYSNGGTFTLTTTNGASASFTFNGTGVWIFGAKRANHGPYKVVLDNILTTGDGFGADPGLFKTPLFAASNLADGLHTVTITNLQNSNDRPYLDIDFITWESERSDGGNVADVVSEDTDKNFIYEPASAWNTKPANVNSFSGGNGHSTTQDGATVSFKFKGSTVSIFGSIGPSNSPYTVQLDGGQPQSYNATKRDFVAQTLLYYADGLGSSDHTLKLTNQPLSSGQTLNIDFAVVNTTPSGRNSGNGGVQPTGTGNAPSQSTGLSNNLGSSGLSGGAIAGIVIGILVLLGVIALLFLFLRRRRNNMSAMQTRIEQQFMPPSYDATVGPESSTNLNQSFNMRQSEPMLGVSQQPPQSEMSSSHDGLGNSSTSSRSDGMYLVRSLPAPPLMPMNLSSPDMANTTFPQYRNEKAIGRGSGSRLVVLAPPTPNRSSLGSLTDHPSSATDWGSRR